MMRSRFGPMIPKGSIDLRNQSQRTVLGAFGVPLAFIDTAAAGSLREQWRLFLHALVKPLSKIIMPELSYKLAVPMLKFSFTDLAASDIQGRARAFNSMVKAGMEIQEAKEEAGIGTS